MGAELQVSVIYRLSGALTGAVCKAKEKYRPSDEIDRNEKSLACGFGSMIWTLGAQPPPAPRQVSAKFTSANTLPTPSTSRWNAANLPSALITVAFPSSNC